jgi:FkbM family methyltransferase
LAILHLIRGQILEWLYYSKFSSILIRIYDYLYKNEKLKLHKTFHGIVMEVDLSKPAERAIPFNAFEPTITRHFLDIVKEGGVVFDVGAWIGYYALLAAKNAEKVVAIEADKTNYQRIIRNVDFNSFSNIIVLNIAVGDKSSTGVLLEAQVSSMHKVASIGIGKKIEIESLDNIITKLNIKKINVLIMDIEGYEYFALKGLQNSLTSRIIKNIICEIHPKFLEENGVTESDIVKLLSTYDYTIITLQKLNGFKPYHIYAKLLHSD